MQSIDAILERLAIQRESDRIEREAILEEARASLRSLGTEEERRRTSGFRAYREKVQTS